MCLWFLLLGDVECVASLRLPFGLSTCSRLSSFARLRNFPCRDVLLPVSLAPTVPAPPCPPSLPPTLPSSKMCPGLPGFVLLADGAWGVARLWRSSISLLAFPLRSSPSSQGTLLCAEAAPHDGPATRCDRALPRRPRARPVPRPRRVLAARRRAQRVSRV